MRKHMVGTLLLVLVFSISGWCQEKAKPKKLPKPRPVPAIPPSYIRINRYDVWKYYDIDRYGVFRPVIISSPYGGYRLLDGSPYPWRQTHPLDVMPYVVR